MWAVKSQIHAGGRGKGKFKEAKAGDKGGVRIAKSVDEVKEFAEQMLGSTLVTLQTGPKGKQVNRIYVEQGSAIDKEFYLKLKALDETTINERMGKWLFDGPKPILKRLDKIIEHFDKLIAQYNEAAVFVN